MGEPGSTPGSPLSRSTEPREGREENENGIGNPRTDAKENDLHDVLSGIEAHNRRIRNVAGELSSSVTRLMHQIDILAGSIPQKDQREQGEPVVNPSSLIGQMVAAISDGNAHVSDIESLVVVLNEQLDRLSAHVGQPPTVDRGGLQNAIGILGAQNVRPVDVMQPGQPV